MSDMVDEINRLYAEATKGNWQPTCDDDESEDPNGIVVSGIRIAEFVGENEIRRRMTKGRAERPGSTFGPDSLDEVDANARLTSVLHNAWPALYDRLVAAERKARALDHIAKGAGLNGDYINISINIQNGSGNEAEQNAFDVLAASPEISK